MPRFAALDLGSNALRLRIAETQGPIPMSDAADEGPPSSTMRVNATPPSNGKSNGFSEVVSLRVPVRLGSDVFATGSLSATSINQACAALREFRKAMDTAHVDSYRAVATAAARDADNAGVLIERARREAGIELEVIEGIEEARLIQLAMTRRIRLDTCRAMLIDVGGGSSEFTLLENGKVAFSTSLPLGTVRLLDAYLRTSSAPTRRQVRLVDETVDRALAELREPLGGASVDAFVGSGGNVDTLAELCPLEGGHGAFGRAIDLAQLKQFSQKAAALSTDERQKAFGLRADRADTILPASRIFMRAAEVFKVPAIVAPGVGLKEGLLLELADKH
ncbi:MAG: Ppx/GppA family phosphatase, partial [Polyangiaceae bacterium]